MQSGLGVVFEFGLHLSYYSNTSKINIFELPAQRTGRAALAVPRSMTALCSPIIRAKAAAALSSDRPKKSAPAPKPLFSLTVYTVRAKAPAIKVVYIKL